MKKIITILVIVIIPAFLIFCGLYVFGEMKMNRSINDAVDNFDQSYYKGIASTCFNKSQSTYECCVSSVHAMNAIGARAMSDDEECNGRIDKLDCAGSFTWCIQDEEMSPDNNLFVQKSCVVDEDCVADKCCHATGVVNKEFAPDCSDVMCTMSCETVLDCGSAVPVCNDGICDIGLVDKSGE